MERNDIAQILNDGLGEMFRSQGLTLPPDFDANAGMQKIYRLAEEIVDKHETDKAVAVDEAKVGITPELREEIKEEVKAELRPEIKEEVRAEVISELQVTDQPLKVEPVNPEEMKDAE